MTDTFIETTLIAALKTLTTLITDSNVAWPNEAFPQDLENGWYEVHFLPGEPSQVELGTGSTNRWVGIFQIDLCVPLNIGKAMINARYDALAVLFARGAIFNGVKIEKIYRGPDDPGSDHYRLPVRIEYRADLSN